MVVTLAIFGLLCAVPCIQSRESISGPSSKFAFSKMAATDEVMVVRDFVQTKEKEMESTKDVHVETHHR
jgi:hypothetical protein